MCILIYKVIHGITPTPLRNLLTLRSKSRNLRGELILVQPRVITTEYGLNTFRYYGPKIWNSLNDELRTCLLYTSPSPRDGLLSRMPSSA